MKNFYALFEKVEDGKLFVRTGPHGPVSAFPLSPAIGIDLRLKGNCEIFLDASGIVTKIVAAAGTFEVVDTKPTIERLPQKEPDVNTGPEERLYKDNMTFRLFGRSMLDEKGQPITVDPNLFDYLLRNDCNGETHDCAFYRNRPDEPWSLWSFLLHRHVTKDTVYYFRAFEPGKPYGKLTVASSKAHHGPGLKPVETFLVPSALEISFPPVGEYLRCALSPDSVVLAAGSA